MKYILFFIQFGLIFTLFIANVIEMIGECEFVWSDCLHKFLNYFTLISINYIGLQIAKDSWRDGI